MRQPLHKIILIGLFASLIFVATCIKIVFPLPAGYTMVHLGHVVCLLAALLLGPLAGALACSVGSVLFDLFNPSFMGSAPFTFLFKFILGFLCGKIYTSKKLSKQSFNVKIIIATALGTSVYMMFHILKIFVYHLYFFKTSLATAAFISAKSLVLNLIKNIVSICLVVTLMNKLKNYEKLKNSFNF